MLHVFYALFDNAERAHSAVEALDAPACHEPRASCRVIVHEGTLRTSELPVKESSARRSGLDGAIVGAVFGLLMGLLFAGPLHLIQGGIVSGMLFAGIAGAVLGGLGGTLVGVGEPDLEIDSFAEELKRGKVLVTIEAPSLRGKELAETVLRDYGATLKAHRTIGYHTKASAWLRGATAQRRAPARTSSFT